MGERIIYYTPMFKMHIPPRNSHHMESPQRLEAALNSIRLHRVLGPWSLEDPGQGSLKFFESAHDPMYIAGLLSELEVALDSYFIDSDTYISQGTQAALEAMASAGRKTVDGIIDGSIKAALILGRPPGHHAGVSGPGLGAPSLGGCLLNTAAAIAMHLSRKGLGVAILDFDLGHGNGTQEVLQAFAPDNAFMIDVHQDWKTTFPWTGEPGTPGEGPVLNISLPKGSGDDIFMSIVDGIGGLLQEAGVDVVVVSAGFGAYRGDSPLTQTLLTSNSFHAAGGMLAKGGWRVAAVLELGFGAGLERGLPAFLAGLAGHENPVAEDKTSSSEGVWKEFLDENKEALDFG